MEKIILTYLDEDRPIDIRAIAREAARLEVLGLVTPETPNPEETAR